MTVQTTAAPKADRAPQVPEKFLDPASGEIRADALLKAYRELERKLSGMVKVPGPDGAPEELAAFRRATGVPDSHEHYEIRTTHPALCPDAELNRRLHQAGFTPEQVQLVYDLAHERVPAMVDQAVGELRHRHSLERLKDHFGGEAKWNETARQLTAWGKANLPAEIYAVLSASPEGIKALQRLMTAGEPALGHAPTPADAPASEEQLKRMMQDPRYWKTRDPAYIEKVSAGFRKLYGEE